MHVAVTGAYGYSGQYIAQCLLAAGHEVLTLTNSPHRANPFGERVKAFRCNFSKPTELEKSLSHVDVLINNYWVRFEPAELHLRPGDRQFESIVRRRQARGRRARRAHQHHQSRP